MIRTLLTAAATAWVTSTAVTVIGAGPTGALPLRLAQSGYVVHSQETTGWPLAAVFGVAQHRGNPQGPQALEGYVYVNPPAGESVRLAMAVISNGEHAGAGELVEMRAAGGHVSGSGHVREWWMHRPVVQMTGPGSIGKIVAYSASVPAGPQVGERWGLYFEDASLPHRLDGTVQVGELAFPNGWRLRPVGDTLALVRPDGSVERWLR